MSDADDPMPLRGGVCTVCGREFCNFSGRCLACPRPPDVPPRTAEETP